MDTILAEIAIAPVFTATKIHTLYTLFRGRCLGVRLEPRGSSDFDKHICVAIEIEDDGIWHKKTDFSSYWLDELIEKLQEAKRYCESQEPDIHAERQYGWNFKGE